MCSRKKWETGEIKLKRERVCYLAQISIFYNVDHNKAGKRRQHKGRKIVEAEGGRV